MCVCVGVQPTKQGNGTIATILSFWWACLLDLIGNPLNCWHVKNTEPASDKTLLCSVVVVVVELSRVRRTCVVEQVCGTVELDWESIGMPVRVVRASLTKDVHGIGFGVVGAPRTWRPRERSRKWEKGCSIHSILRRQAHIPLEYNFFGPVRNLLQAPMARGRPITPYHGPTPQPSRSLATLSMGVLPISYDIMCGAEQTNWTRN